MRAPKQISDQIGNAIIDLASTPHTLIVCIPVGSEVVIGGSVTATVLQICIQSNSRVTYEVAWWDGNTRSTAWVDAGEIEKYSGERVRIGF